MRPIFALLICLLALNAVAASAKPFSGEEDLGQWVTFYYKNPEPARLADAVESASRLGFFQEGKASPPFFGFIAGVLGKQPTVAASTLKRLANLPPVDQPVVVLGVWYSGHKDTKRMLTDFAKAAPAQKQMIDGLLASSAAAPRLTEIALEEGPWVLDALWGMFMATGDEAPVVRIMTALPWVNVRGDTGRLLVGGAARWSLTSNAVQHPRVLEICRAQVARQPKDIAAALGEVIAQAEEDLKKERAALPGADEARRTPGK